MARPAFACCGLKLSQRLRACGPWATGAAASSLLPSCTSGELQCRHGVDGTWRRTHGSSLFGTVSKGYLPPLPTPLLPAAVCLLWATLHKVTEAKVPRLRLQQLAASVLLSCSLPGCHVVTTWKAGECPWLFRARGGGPMGRCCSQRRRAMTRLDSFALLPLDDHTGIRNM